MSLAECLEVSNFKFRQLKKLVVSPDSGQSSEKSVGLLTASSRFGFIFAGHPKGFKVLRVSSILAIDEAESGKTSQKPVEEFPHLPVSLPSDPFLLALSADNMTLAVGIFKGQCAVALLYDIRIFLTTDPAPASFLEIRLSSSPGVSVLDFFWNPSSGDTFAVCLSDGSANVYEISTPNNFKILGSLPSTTGATSLCWSPKGKQLVIGKRDGRLAQYKPNLLDCVKIVEQPTIFQNSMAVTSILWLETHLFAAAYQNPQDDSQPNLVLSSVPKGSNPSYLNFNDVCYGNGDGPAKYWMHHLSAWRTMICCSSSALETAVVGCTEEKGLWVQWILEDTARAELPMVQSKETYPLGMAIVYCSENRIVISETESYPPMPILLLLNNTGQLCPFHIIYTGSTVSLVSPPESLIADVVRRPSSLPSSQPVLAPAPVPVISSQPAPVTLQPVTPPSLNMQGLGQPIHMSTPLDMPSKLETPSTPKTNLLQKFTEESPKQTSLFAPLTKPEAQRQEPKPIASRAPQPGAFMFSGPGQSGSLVTSSPKGPMESTFPMSSGSLFRPTNLSSSSALSPLPASTNAIGSNVTSNNATKGSRPTLTAVAPSKNMLKLTSQDIIKPSADNTYVQAFLDEVQDFQREIEELGSTLAQNIEIGTKEEMALIRKSTHDATNFSTEIKKTLQSIQSDVNQLKSALIETFALLEEARSRDLRDRDPVYLNLLRTRALDPCSQRQLKEIRRLAQYVSGQLQEVHLKLDMDWQDELQKPQHKNKTSINKQGLTTLYQALANNLAVIDCLETSLEIISQRFKDLKANKEISHSFHNVSLDVNELSSNFESVSLGNRSAQQQQHSNPVSSIKRLTNKTIGRQQENSLREVLTQRPIRVVKAKPIADLSESRLVSALHTMQMNMSNAVKPPPSSVQSFQPVQMSQPVLQTVPTLPKTVVGTPLGSVPLPGTPLTSVPVAVTPLTSTPVTGAPLASIPVAGTTVSSIPVASLTGPPPNVSVAQSTPVLSGRITKGQPFKPLPEETKSVPAVSKSAQGLPVLFLTKSHSPVSVHQPQPISTASTTTPTLAVFSAFQPKVTIAPVSSTAGISHNGKIASSNAPTPQFSFSTPVPTTSVSIANTAIITPSSQDYKFHLPTSANEEKNPCPKFENITPPESPQPTTAKQDGKPLSCSPTEDSKVIQVSLNTSKSDGSPTVKVSSLQTSPVQVIAATALPNVPTTSSTQPVSMAVSFSFKDAFSTASITSPSSGFSLSHLKSATSSTTSPTTILVLSSGESGLPANRFQFSTPTWGLGSGSAFSQPKFSFNAAAAEKTNPTIAVTSSITTPSTTSTTVSLTSLPVKTPTVTFSSGSEKSLQLVQTASSATTAITPASFTPSVTENTSVLSTETKPDSDSTETTPKNSTLAQPAVTSSSILFVPKPGVTAAPLFGQTAATTTTPTPFCQAPPATFSFGTKTNQPTSTAITPASTESAAVSTSPTSLSTTAIDSATTCVSSPIFGQQVTTATTTASFGGLLSTATSTSASTQSAASVFSSTTTTATTTTTGGGAVSGGGIFGSSTPDVTGVPPVFSQVTTSAPSLFGQPVSETAPISGNPIFSQPQELSAGGLFSGTGSNVSFGQPAGGGAGASAFGQPGQSVFGKSQSFGTTAFGQPQPTSTTLSFGTVTGPFGQAVTSSQPAPAFGQPPSFGQAPSFGQPSPTSSGSLFGQQQTPNLGSATTGNTAGSPFSGNFFMGLGGKPSAENAGKNIFATSGGSGAQDSTTLFGAQGASTFGTAAQAVTGFSGNFSSGGTVAQTGFAAFQQTPPRPSGFGSPPAFGSSPVFSGSPVFGSTTGFGVNNFGMPSPPPQSSQTFGSFVSTSAPSFDTLAAQSPSFGNLAQQTQPQQPAQMGSPAFGSFGGQSPSGFGSQSSAFSQWRQ